MTTAEMEYIIERYAHPLQSILHAAFVIQEIATIGGQSTLSAGGGRGDQTHLIDVSIGLTKHIQDGEELKLVRWLSTPHVEPHEFPRLVLRYWRRVPVRAAEDMAKITHNVV